MYYPEVTYWTWRNNKKIGIVVVLLDKSGTWAAYIGIAPGIGEEEDAAYISQRGQRLSCREAMGFFPGMDYSLYKSQ